MINSYSFGDPERETAMKAAEFFISQQEEGVELISLTIFFYKDTGNWIAVVTLDI